MPEKSPVREDSHSPRKSADHIQHCYASAISVSAKMGMCEDTVLCSYDRRNASFPNIACHALTLQLRGADVNDIGSIKAQLLDKQAMAASPVSNMWDQCQSYDSAHMPYAKLEKVENYLANESFGPYKANYLNTAGSILYIEEVRVIPALRGNGLGLLAVDLVIDKLGPDDSCVVLLQPGPIGQANKASSPGPWEHLDNNNGESDTAQGTERLAKHWRRMGFREWSDSDKSWLCLQKPWRPKIENVVPALFKPPKSAQQAT